MENVGPGDYNLSIYVSPDDGKSNVLYFGPDYLGFPALTRKVTVPQLAGGRSPETMDIGNMEIQHPRAQRRIRVGDQALNVNATNDVPVFQGQQFTLSNYPGKYVLLDLCGNYFDDDLPFLQAAHDAFAQDKRLVMASVKLGYFLQDGSPLASIRTPDLWELANTGPIQKSEWAEAYGLLDQDTLVRQIVLIGPDGRILAKDLHGDDIRAALSTE